MLRTVPRLDRRSAAVTRLSKSVSCTSVMESSPYAARVAAMLRSMYGASFSDSAGSTRRFWMTAG